jgi:hypothetical protein
VATLTKRTKRKFKITIKSKQIELRTLKVESKMPSGPTPLPPHRHAVVQPSTTPPRTEPLGAHYRLVTVLELGGLLVGLATWRLFISINHRSEKTTHSLMEVGEVALRPLKKAANGLPWMLSREQLQCSPSADLSPRNHHPRVSVPQHRCDETEGAQNRDHQQQARKMKSSLF